MKRRIKLFGIAIIFVAGFAGISFAQAKDTLTLSRAIQMAIRNSPSLMEGEASVAQAKAHYRELESYGYPQLSADASYTRIDPVISLSIPLNGKLETFSTEPNDNYNGAVSLQQPIWTFGRLDAEDRVAESGIKSAADNLEQFRAQIAYQTTQVYYGVLTTDKGITVEQQQVSVLQGNLADAKKREAQGTATSLDTLNIQARISATQSQIAEMKANRRKQVALLRRLLALPAGTMIAVVQPAAIPLLPEQEDTLMALAKKQRSELVSAEDAESTAKLQIDQAKNTNDPLLAANVAGGVKDGYLPNLTQPKLNWAGTVSLHIPILDGGRTDAQVDEAQAQFLAAQARTEDVKRSIQSDIEQALADIQSSRLRLGLLGTQIKQAQQAYSVAQVRYQNGAATNLDVLTAQSELEQAELQQAQLTFNYELSEYNLNRAVGTVIW